ncbi:MAG: hypothetical protein U0R51_11560 [Solirubrobacterales bacterium]
MSYFRDADEVYRVLGGILETLGADEELSIGRADTVVENRYSDPDAVITMTLRPEEPALVEFGASSAEPEIVLTMASDVAHRFWLGEVNVPLALARGEMTATGPTPKLLALVPLLESAFPRYRELLTSQGRSDLAEA